MLGTQKRRMVLAHTLIWANLFFWLRPSPAQGANKCEQIDVTEFKSPDARWFARRYGYVCDLGIMTSAAVKVDLVLAAAPGSASTTILSVDMPSDKLQWPKPEWEAPKKLVLQLPASTNIALQMASFQGVEIQLRFCPGDSAIRDRWLTYKSAYHQWVVDMATWSKLRSQDPRAAGPEPVAPKPPEGAQPDASCLR